MGDNVCQGKRGRNLFAGYWFWKAAAWGFLSASLRKEGHLRSGDRGREKINCRRVREVGVGRNILMRITYIPEAPWDVSRGRGEDSLLVVVKIEINSIPKNKKTGREFKSRQIKIIKERRGQALAAAAS